MNERIKLLAEQARSEVRADWDKANKIPYPEAHYVFQRDNDQKFAELIVRDTIKLLQQEWYDRNNAPPVEGESARDVGIRVGRKSEVIALMSKVSKHFGVEE